MIVQIQDSLLGNENAIYVHAKFPFQSSEYFPYNPFDVIPPDCVSNFRFNLNSQTGFPGRIGQSVNHKITCGGAFSPGKYSMKITGFAEPMEMREGLISPFGHCTDNRFRPLDRLLLITFLPERDFILTRKPCVFLRFRLFGWYVRFMTPLSSLSK